MPNWNPGLFIVSRLAYFPGLKPRHVYVFPGIAGKISEIQA
jgi:hypothetical protein